MNPAIETTPEVDQETPEFRVLLDRIVALAKTETGIYLIAGFVLLLIAGWPFTMGIPTAWFESDSYYQHGPLIPLAILYVFALRYPEWKQLGYKASWVPLVLLPLPLYIIWGSARQVFPTGTGLAYMVALALMAWAFLGFKWLVRLIPFLALYSTAIPMWGRLLDEKTSNLQILSTKISYYFLKLVGQDPYLESPTVINLPHFDLNIAEACSGMKMTLAMISMALFILVAAKLKWWGNLIILALAMPLAIIMNGIRIGIIGVTGNNMGSEAGMMMHDYGSYVIMGFAFYLMYMVAKWLGWKI